MPRPLRVLLPLCAALFLLFAGSASAATTYYVTADADPNSTTCTQHSPCLFGYAAANVGGPGDTIDVASGTYNLIGDITVHAGVTISGPSNDTARVLNGTTNQNTSLNLTLGEHAALNGIMLSKVAVTFGEFTSAQNDDIRATHVACNISQPDVTIVGTICQGTELGSATIYPAVEVAPASGNGTVLLRNDVMYSTRRALDYNSTVTGETLTVENSIMRVADTSNAQTTCPIKLVGKSGTNGSVTVNLSNNNYDALPTGNGACGGDGFAVHLTQTTPESGDPQLKRMEDDLVGADFQETSTSPTRNEGETADIPPFTYDLNSNQRVIGPDDSPRTDIGAYELIDPPTVSTLAPTGLTATGVTLNSTVNGFGVSTSSTYGYGVDTDSDNLSDAINDPAASKSFEDSVTLTGLTPNTTYKWQLCTLAGNAYVCSDDLTFTTLPLAPILGTPSATAVTQTAAQLGVSVDPHGGDTMVHFEYGPTTSYGSSTTATSIPASTGLSTATAALSGLTAGTIYHVRAVAVSAGGTVDSSDITVTTAAATTQTTTGTTTTPSGSTGSGGSTTPPGSTTPIHTTTTPTPTPAAPVRLALKFSGLTVKLASASSAIKLTGLCAGPAGQKCRVSGLAYLSPAPHTKKGTKPKPVGKVTGTLVVSRRGSLVLVLNRATRSLLARKHALRFTVLAVVTDADHQRASVRTTVTVKAKVTAKKRGH